MDEYQGGPCSALPQAIIHKSTCTCQICYREMEDRLLRELLEYTSSIPATTCGCGSHCLDCLGMSERDFL